LGSPLPCFTRFITAVTLADFSGAEPRFKNLPFPIEREKDR
jgi:hypothetical protein